MAEVRNSGCLAPENRNTFRWQRRALPGRHLENNHQHLARANPGSRELERALVAAEVEVAIGRCPWKLASEQFLSSELPQPPASLLSPCFLNSVFLLQMVLHWKKFRVFKFSSQNQEGCDSGVAETGFNLVKLFLSPSSKTTATVELLQGQTATAAAAAPAAAAAAAAAATKVNVDPNLKPANANFLPCIR